MEKGKLTDYEGTYERFLEKNEAEAEVMAAKEQKKKELDKSQIKAKSKVRGPWLSAFWYHTAWRWRLFIGQSRHCVRAQGACVREEQ